MEREATIKRNLIILGVATFLLVVIITTAWFLLLVRPQKEAIAKAQSEFEARKTLADGLKSALAAQRKSEDELAYAKDQIEFLTGTSERQGRFRSLYFGEIEGSSEANKLERQLVWHRWLNEYHSGFGQAFNNEIERIARVSGVMLNKSTSTSGGGESSPEDGEGNVAANNARDRKNALSITVDSPPRNPEDVKLPPHGFMLPLSNSNGGAVGLSITGDLSHIMRFFDEINQSSILMVVGNVKLSGYSPIITATFPVTPYLLASGTAATVGGGSSSGAEAEGGPDDMDMMGDMPPEELEE